MQITTHTEHRWVVVGFDGVLETIEELDIKAPAVAGNADVWRELQGQINRATDWATGGRTRAELIEALSCPSEKLLAEIEDAKRALEDAVPALAGRDKPRRVRRRNEDFGDEVGNESRYLMRDPYCWDRMTRESRPGKIIRLGVHIGGTCNVQHADTVRRGAVALALADWLTANGYNVAIDGVVAASSVSAGRGAAWGVGAVIPLKRSAEPLDIGSLATVLCELAYYRAVILTSRALRAPFMVDGSLGTTTRNVPAVLAGDYDLIVPSTILGAADAATWLDEAIAKLTAAPEGE